MAERQRSGIPHVTSGLPKRAPSPSSAAFSSARSSSGGPLGSYRPASRNGSERPASQAGEASTSSRFGFGSAAPSSSIAVAVGNGKRTLSSAGLREPETPGPNGSSSKRPLFTSSSATSSPRFPQASPSYDATMLKSEYERRELLSKQAYDKLQGEYKASGRELERFKQERLALLRQWEEANSKRKEEKESFEEQRKFLNNRVNTLQQQNQELRTRCERVQAERAQLAQSSHEEKTKLSLQITDLEYKLASTQAQAEESKEIKDKVVASFEIKEKEWQEERSRLEQRYPSEGGDSKKLTVELSELLTKIHKLESESLTLQQENRILKTKTESIEALKEQKRDLEERMELVDELRRKHAEAEARIKDLEAEKQDWNQKLSSGGVSVAFANLQATCSDPFATIPSIEAPLPLTMTNLPTYLSSLQGALSGLKSRSASFESRANLLKKECTTFEEAIQQEKEKRRALKVELSAEKTERLKSAKMAASAKSEVESYVKLLDTFQEESRNQSTQYNAASAEQIQVLQARIQTMEADLNESQREAEELRLLTQGGGGISKSEREELEKKNEVREKELLKCEY